MRKFIIVLVPVVCIAGCVSAEREVSWAKEPRVRANFDSGWKFLKADVKYGERIDFDDSKWLSVDVPHDWSIEGPFSRDNPSRSDGGYLPGGVGWYRKFFKVPPDYANKKVFVEFDGVYMNSDVWINGRHLGRRPYGYISFEYELTPYLNYGDKGNVLAVRVDNSMQPNSRWYSGSGVYRHVWLTVTDKLHVSHWGTYVTTPKVSRDSATVNIKTTVKNEYPDAKRCVLITAIADKNNKVVKTVKSASVIEGNNEYEFVQDIKINRPKLWSPDNPYLYKVYSTVKSERKVADNYETVLGVREFYFDADKGFFLNGKNIKIKGTCNHHDCGCLGAACPDRAKERQIEILKTMGCNAVRTSHNPPSPVLLDYCDRYGLLVMDEAFDEWKRGKLRYGYHEYFDEWAEEDLRSMIRRDRNHPSVIMWSVGNEIPEQSRPEGVEILKGLIKVVREEDPTRPVTSGCNRIKGANRTGFAELLDVVGYNYGEEFYDEDHSKYPARKILASETASALGTRGVYHTPADKLVYKTEDKYCSCYDNCWVPWGSSAGYAWRQVQEREFVAGEFIWTGFDYIGEPTPYPWPARSSYFGILDLCGFPKDAYYFYQSQWTDKPMVHIFPHWNWPGKEGINIPVWCYSNCDSVELFLNGRSMGAKYFEETSDLHLSWDVPYGPGVLKAVGKKDGKVVCTRQVRTAGKAVRIALAADRSTIAADGKDICFITASIFDKEGNLVPDASNVVTFKVTGPGEIIGVDNGDQLSREDFKSNRRKAFNGLCLAVVQSEHKAGRIRIRAASRGLTSGSIIINSRRQ